MWHPQWLSDGLVNANALYIEAGVTYVKTGIVPTGWPLTSPALAPVV